MRLLVLLAALCSLSSVYAAAVAPELYERYASVTGCACPGMFYSNSQLYNNAEITILYPGKPETDNGGWCLTNGRMRQDNVDRIVAALSSNSVTPYVNGTWARTYCDRTCGPSWRCPTATCAQAIANYYNRLISNSNVAQCTYPTSNFQPTDCFCGFVCTNGYVKCGASSCINPSTQTCVSGLPSNRKRDGQRMWQYCPAGRQRCPLPQGGYECVDTQSDLEACGGCPSYAGEATHGNATHGVDCSTLDGVHDVSCVRGSCEITSCDRNHVLLNGQCHYMPRQRRR